MGGGSSWADGTFCDDFLRRGRVQWECLLVGGFRELEREREVCFSIFSHSHCNRQNGPVSVIHTFPLMNSLVSIRSGFDISTDTRTHLNLFRSKPH